MRFVDLFAGLGGFHVGLAELGHTCVFACELDSSLRRLYHKNFGLECEGDIRECYSRIPEHDVLCAGFPCQPFSKAGDQLGEDCPDSGDLFQKYVVGILQRNRPRYFIMENVPNLLKHAQGRTWSRMQEQLEALDYDVSSSVLSPEDFGIPQKRPRAFIVGSQTGLDDFEWPTPNGGSASLRDFLDETPSNSKELNPSLAAALNVWQEFLEIIPVDQSLSAFPIWAMEFGATYPYLSVNPVDLSDDQLRGSRGCFGGSWKSHRADRELFLPRYSQTKVGELPRWLKSYITQNRSFYSAHQHRLADWLPKVMELPASYQKLEWTWKEGPRCIFEALIQFRPSGIRVKRPDMSPSLVALNTSQVPVIGWKKRYLSLNECAKLQSLDRLQLEGTRASLTRALGNAVNARVVENIGQALLSQCQLRGCLTASSGKVTGRQRANRWQTPVAATSGW